MTAALPTVLAPLIGTFAGAGAGEFPTVDPFRYREEVSFTSNGTPVLAYRQRTWGLESGRPMHAEDGFLRLAGDTRVELLLAHSFGLTEVQEGELEVEVAPGGVLRLRLTSTAIGVAGSAKPVDAVQRELMLDGDVLRSELWMSYAGVQSQHLVSELHRAG